MVQNCNSQYFADQLTLFQPRGADSAHPLLPAPPKFFTFRSTSLKLNNCHQIDQVFHKTHLCVVLATSFVLLIIRARYLVHSFLAVGSQFLFFKRQAPPGLVAPRPKSLDRSIMLFLVAMQRSYSRIIEKSGFSVTYLAFGI